jgi:hypothetical protein
MKVEKVAEDTFHVLGSRCFWLSLLYGSMFRKKQRKNQAQQETELQESEHVHVWDEIELLAKYPGEVTMLRRCRDQECGVRQVKTADKWYPITLTNYELVLLREIELTHGIIHCPKCGNFRISEYIGIKEMYRCDNCGQLFHREDFLQMSADSASELEKRLIQLERFVIQLFEKEAIQPVPVASISTAKNQMRTLPDRTKATLENFEEVLPKEEKQKEEARRQGDKGSITADNTSKERGSTGPKKLDSSLPKLDTHAKVKLDRLVERVADKDHEELDKVPSHAELDELKKLLLLSSGSLCFKHGSVHLVKCDGKKRSWTRLGSWQELKKKL